MAGLWVGECTKGRPSPLTPSPSCLSGLRATQLRQLFHISLPSPKGRRQGRHLSLESWEQLSPGSWKEVLDSVSGS